MLQSFNFKPEKPLGEIHLTQLPGCLRLITQTSYFGFFSDFLENKKFSKSFNNIFEDSSPEVSLRQNISFENLKA